MANSGPLEEVNEGGEGEQLPWGGEEDMVTTCFGLKNDFVADKEL